MIREFEFGEMIGTKMKSCVGLSSPFRFNFAAQIGELGFSARRWFFPLPPWRGLEGTFVLILA
jgi:hypothetical protein